MSYIKFINDDTEYPASVMPFNTQHGIAGVRIISDDLPVNESGFMFYSSQGELIGDYSGYQHHYEGNSYSVAEDIINYGGGSNAPLRVNAFSQLENHISNLNAFVSKVADDIDNVSEEVKDITPYTETKTAYIADTEIVFETDVQGVIGVSTVNRDGDSIPVQITRVGNKITISFEPLESVTQVTLNIQ